jgi:uncharacterized repeat protein (TIGR04076 family)
MNLSDNYPSGVKITVLRRFKPEEVFKEPPVKANMKTACSAFKDGQVFNVEGKKMIDYKMREGFCPWAWDTLFPWVTALALRADFSTFYPDNPEVAIISCIDGMRPVIFKLERT